jgi:hypothetical protein
MSVAIKMSIIALKQNGHAQREMYPKMYRVDPYVFFSQGT